ncbi:MAG: ATP-binding cassette domain-containing protein [Chitinophagaceae bacterium]|nr:MAG: ATP-binding cassette domain-containing protein [Chitinophagaceae bacterium]
MDFDIKQLAPGWFTNSQAIASEVWSKDLSFQQGELIEIIAPSGSGKTSLIHFLYGMRGDYRGAIQYNNNAFRFSDHELLAQYRKDHLSVVFQDMRLFNSQSVFQNIEIKRQLSPYHEPGMIHDMASRLGISDKLDAPCGNCSYGEQQRIAIIRSLMQPFEILLLDEPFSHLDRNNAEKAMKLILEEVGKRNATVIFADLEQTNFYPRNRVLYL